MFDTYVGLAQFLADAFGNMSDYSDEEIRQALSDIDLLEIALRAAEDEEFLSAEASRLQSGLQTIRELWYPFV